MQKRMIKKIISITAVSLMMINMLCACGKSDQMSVEDEVAMALEDYVSREEIPAEDNTGVAAEQNADTDTEEKSTMNSSVTKDESKTDSDSETKDTSPKATAAASSKKADTGAVCINPFLGSTSTATSFYISFNIETDSGVAGITWGSMDGTDGEYYLFAFDCTRDIPMLYTSRRQGDAVYDETYTNLDFMYPEMVMFTSVEHIVEIVVSQTTATVYLDKYKVCDTILKTAKPVGQFGTWVQDGDYHEYIDNLFVAEDVDGQGDWIYSDDFAHRNNLFAPALKTESGRLYATAGYHVAPKKE
ncbi:MAG: hypothetical protein K6G12_11400 [Lachnospiraceae bacterium]|nr:hypothetical protein [Lachnospiraceae bacterium]